MLRIGRRGDTTPNVILTWDTGSGCLKGYLCAVQAGAATTTRAYNVLGQITSGAQTTATVTYPYSYQYDLQGNVKSITYPSGRVITYSLSAAGRATAVGTYATNITYAPHGGLATLPMGNGVQETVSYDARLRAQTISAVQGSTLLSVTNNYALNGNVHTQQVSFAAANYTQTFG